jgi:60S ribosome subunit biogenesis protein NIP7
VFPHEIEVNLFCFLLFSIGANVKLLIDRADGTYCFRENKNRVYYVSEKILLLSTNVPPDKLVTVGTCFGKFTKTGKFILHITALTYLAPYAQVRILYVLTSATGVREKRNRLR